MHQYLLQGDIQSETPPLNISAGQTEVPLTTPSPTWMTLLTLTPSEATANYPPEQGSSGEMRRRLSLYRMSLQALW